MKRLFVLGLAIMAFGVNAFSSGNEVISKLNDEKVFNGITRYLGTNNGQNSDLRYVFTQSESRLKKETAKGENEEVATLKALNFSLANAKVILSNEQYKRFARILNISVHNEMNKELFAEK